MGFSDDYREKLSEEDLKKYKDKFTDPRFHVKTSIGSVKDNYNPVVLIHSYIAKEISSLNAIELTLSNRYNSYAIDNKPFDPNTFSFKNPVVSKLYRFMLDPSNLNINTSKNAYMKTLTIKSIHN